jgi:acyl carrier protein
LFERLPAAMVPADFVFLDSLPLTPNGKVDRKALPPVDLNNRRSEPTHVAPRTELERQLAEIWAEILRVPTIGVLDNFFDLGGHSLLAMQVVSRIRNTMQVELPLRVFFEKPTVAGLAEHLETIRWISDARTTVLRNELGVL